MILPVTNASPVFYTAEAVSNADHTITGTNGRMIMYSGLTAARVLTLPASSQMTQTIMIMDEDGSCNLTNSITINAGSGDNIEGNASRLLNYPYAALTLESNGSGSWIVVANPNPSISAGIQIPPTYTDNGDGSITFTSGLYCFYTNISGIGKIKRFTLAGTTFTLTDNTNQFIVADYNSGSPTIYVTTNVSVINETTIIPIYTIYRRGTILHILEWDSLGDALGNKTHQSIVKTQRFRVEPGGLGIGEVATRTVTVGSGTVWHGAVPTSLSTFNSSTNTMWLAYHVAGVWTFSTITQYNNTQYDDGTNLQTLPGGKYAVNFVYRMVGTNDTTTIVFLGQGAYSLGQAQESQPPANLPGEVLSHAILVGRIIVDQGGTTATQIDSAFTTLFTPGGVTDHEALLNLLGAGPNHYHPNATEYAGTGTGPLVRQTSPALLGTPTAPTPATADNSTTIATTAYVKNQAYVINPMTTTGDMIYGGTSGTPTRLPIGATNYWLKVVGGNPVWTALASGDITGALGFTPINKAGDTGIGNLSMAALSATSITSPSFVAGILKGNGSTLSAAIANTDYVTPGYVQSRGNLITNGTGVLKSNYNFSQFTFDGTDAYYSTGCFSNNIYTSSNFSDEIIPIDPNQTYKLSVMAKSNPHAVGSHAYIGVASYDADGLAIASQYRMYQANTLTTLAADLVNGATTIQLTSAANWNNAAGSSSWLRGIIVWNYVNSLGYAFPALTYSRNVWLNLYADGGISGNVITLSAPWTGGTIPAGTQLSNSNSGSTYSYIAAVYVDIPGTWTNYTGLIGGVDLTGTDNQNAFAPGTAGVKLVFLLNRDVAGNTTKIADVSFGINTIVANTSGAVAIPGALSASSFTGAGTGLTGTASSLSIGGNAATATLATTAKSTPVYTVATLPAGTEGMRAGVTDATATTFASVVAGGGTNHVPVYFDGTNWIIG